MSMLLESASSLGKEYRHHWHASLPQASIPAVSMYPPTWQNPDVVCS